MAGYPRVLLYDNLKSAVLERQADAIRFHPTLLAFAAHYHYEPRPVAVARGNEKGRVERAVRYVRDGFFAARQFVDVDDLNAQAAAWCAGAAADRPCPEQQTLSVRAAFAEETPRLIALPDNAYPLNERVAVKVGRTPMSASISTTTRCLTPRSGACSPCWPIRTRCASSTAPRSSPAIAEATTRAIRSRIPPISRPSSQTSGPHAVIAAPTGSPRRRRRAKPYWRRRPPWGTRGDVFTAALLRLLDRYGAAELEAAIRSVDAVCLTPTRCVWHSIATASSANSPRPSPSTCRRTSRRATPSSPHRLEAYDQLKDQTDE